MIKKRYKYNTKLAETERSRISKIMTQYDKKRPNVFIEKLEQRKINFETKIKLKDETKRRRGLTIYLNLTVPHFTD